MSTRHAFPLTNTERSQLTHPLLVLFVLDSFADQLPSLADDHDNHNPKNDLVYIDLVGHNVISRDRDQYTQNSKRIVSSLSWRGLKAEQLMKQCTNSKEHGEVVPLPYVSRILEVHTVPFERCRVN